MISTLSNAQVLSMWEQAASQPPARRACYLLVDAESELTSISTFAIGERDRRLLLLRKELFGDDVAGMTDCPECTSRVEVRFQASEVAARESVANVIGTTSSNGFVVRWRLPTCGDLADLSDLSSNDRMRERLLELCVVEAQRDERTVAILECPAPVIDDVCTAMAQADPYGDIRLNLGCPACGHSWDVIFDVEAFVWREIDAWSKRLLREIHTLATAYGWSEREILAMSLRRRAAYLELVGS